MNHDMYADDIYLLAPSAIGILFSVCHGDLVPAQCMLTLVFKNFEAVIRKSTFGFIQRLAINTKSLIMAIEISEKKHCTLFQQHAFQLTDAFLKCFNTIFDIL